MHTPDGITEYSYVRHLEICIDRALFLITEVVAFKRDLTPNVRIILCWLFTKIFDSILYTTNRIAAMHYILIQNGDILERNRNTKLR